MDGVCALYIAVLGCSIREEDLNETESIGMRRYPITAEDAFKCYIGDEYEYESRTPDYFDFGNKYKYKEHKPNKKIVNM